MPRADQPCTILIMHDLNSAAALIVRLPKLHTLFVKPRWPGTALRRSTREGSPSTPPHRDAGYGWFEKSSECAAPGEQVVGAVRPAYVDQCPSRRGPDPACSIASSFFSSTN